MAVAKGAPFIGWKHRHTHTHILFLSPLITYEWAQSNELTKMNSTLLCVVVHRNGYFISLLLLWCAMYYHFVGGWPNVWLKQKSHKLREQWKTSLFLFVHQLFSFQQKKTDENEMRVHFIPDEIEYNQFLVFVWSFWHARSHLHLHIQFNGTRWIFYFQTLQFTLCYYLNSFIHTHSRSHLLVFGIVWQK